MRSLPFAVGLTKEIIIIKKKASIGRIGKSIASHRLAQSFVIGSSSLHPELTDVRVAAVQYSTVQ